MGPARRLTSVLILIFCLLGSRGGLQSVESLPEEWLALQAKFGSELLAELEPIQEKYVRALRAYQKDLTKAGDLEAAKNALKAASEAEVWQAGGKRGEAPQFQHPKLADFYSNYEATLHRTAEPFILSYIKRMEEELKEATQKGDLETAVVFKTQKEQILKEAGDPLSLARTSVYSSFDSKQFEDWVKSTRFQFEGNIAGATEIWLKGANLQYKSVRSGTISNYKVEFDSPRSMVISSKGFSIEFSEDLSEGVFVSSRGRYPLKFVVPSER